MGNHCHRGGHVLSGNSRNPCRAFKLDSTLNGEPCSEMFVGICDANCCMLSRKKSSASPWGFISKYSKLHKIIKFEGHKCMDLRSQIYFWKNGEVGGCLFFDMVANCAVDSNKKSKSTLRSLNDLIIEQMPFVKRVIRKKTLLAKLLHKITHSGASLTFLWSFWYWPLLQTSYLIDYTTIGLTYFQIAYVGSHSQKNKTTNTTKQKYPTKQTSHSIIQNRQVSCQSYSKSMSVW